MTWVLPVPAPATTSSGPSPWMTARRCSALSPASSCVEPVRRGAGSSAGGLARAPDRDLDERLRLAAGGPAPHATLRPVRAGGGRRDGAGGRRGVSDSGHAATMRRARASSGVTGRMRIRPSRAPAPEASAMRSASSSSVDRAASDRAGRDRLAVDAGAVARVEAADDEPVAVLVEQGEREALVAARVLERVEAHEPDPLERLALRPLEDRPCASSSSSTSRATA